METSAHRVLSLYFKGAFFLEKGSSHLEAIWPYNTKWLKLYETRKRPNSSSHLDVISTLNDHFGIYQVNAITVKNYYLDYLNGFLKYPKEQGSKKELNLFEESLNSK